MTIYPQFSERLLPELNMNSVQENSKLSSPLPVTSGSAVASDPYVHMCQLSFRIISKKWTNIQEAIG